MSVDFFLDTNVFVYSFDGSSPGKRDVACSLISEALRDGGGAISWQVVQEFLNVALHKWELPMTEGDAQTYLNMILRPLCVVYPSEPLWRAALSIQAQSQYHFYDSLVVASAVHCGAKVLYSEDLQDGRFFGDLEIRNPFLN